jgi:poly(A) polymerase
MTDFMIIDDWLKEPRLQEVMQVIVAAGGEVRVAGGAVRNALLGVPISDVDLATTLLPEEVTRVCKKAGFSVHPTGIDHGTVTVVNRGQPFEVTTLRLDVETDGRRAVVKFTDDWQADAMRRDFTINAMYCDAVGKIFDYTTGYLDIQRKRVRFVGDSAARIKEDYLRILRFFRFHARCIR